MSKASPTPRALQPLAGAAEPVYRAIVARRNGGFNKGKRVTRAKIPVISIGNLSVGGTGKTPMVMHTVRTLKSVWKKPGIVLRGYGAKKSQRADEEDEYRDRMPDVPVVVNPDRVAAVARLRKKHGADVAVLDDAFQHRFIARDLDVVLIDATRSPFEDCCLPAGWLREPVSSLKRADAVIITRADRASEARLAQLHAQIESVSGKAPIGKASHAWEGLVDVTTAQLRKPGSFEGSTLIVACAIGNPEAFVRQVRASTGAEIRESIIKRDHHRWTKPEAGRIARLLRSGKADALIVTHKDWVKLREVLPMDKIGDARVLYPRLGINMIEGGEAYARLVRQTVELWNKA
jgi:tetraacyldisaccharide 4'-kinase